MAEYLIQDTTLTAIADAIRTKTGNEEPIPVNEMATTIGSLDIGGSSGGGIRYMTKHVSNIQGTWKERISIDFGFVPDFIIVVPYKMTTSSGNCIACGMSSTFANAVGTSVGSFNVYVRNNTSTYSSYGTDITDYNENAVIYNTDATGFNIGKALSKGSAYVIAFGL